MDGRAFVNAVRDIRTGEELLIDYAHEVDESTTHHDHAAYHCCCGASACRSTMLSST
nr:hypothetical protein [Burkholderia pseudomallei]